MSVMKSANDHVIPVIPRTILSLELLKIRSEFQLLSSLNADVACQRTNGKVEKHEEQA